MTIPEVIHGKEPGVETQRCRDCFVSYTLLVKCLILMNTIICQIEGMTRLRIWETALKVRSTRTRIVMEKVLKFSLLHSPTALMS